jgi:PAS domain S-box-containing protein
MPGAELAAGMANQAQAFLIQVKMLHLAVVNCSTSRIFATPLQMFLTISFADQSGISSQARRESISVDTEVFSEHPDEPFRSFVKVKMRDQMNNEQRNRDVSNSPKDIICTLDLAGNFTFINRAGEMVSGYSCEEACRLNITEVVAPEFAAYIGEQIKRHVRERFGAVYEIDLITKEGRRVALEVSAQVVWRDGKPVEIQGIAVLSVVRNGCIPPLRLRCLDASFVSIV